MATICFKSSLDNKKKGPQQQCVVKTLKRLNTVVPDKVQYFLLVAQKVLLNKTIMDVDRLGQQ